MPPDAQRVCDQSGFFPQVASNESGNVTAVWSSWGTEFGLNASRADATSFAWSAAHELAADTVTIAQVAVDGAGNAIAVWDHDGVIETSGFDVTTGRWDAAEPLRTVSDGHAYGARVGINEAGDAVAVWEQGADIWACRYDVRTRRWRDVELVEPGAGDADLPRVAVDAAGNATVVWRQSDGARTNIWANRFDTAVGAWGAPQLLETRDVGGVNGPQVAVDGVGNAVTVWSQCNGLVPDIWSNRFDIESGAWGTATLLETASDDATDPQIGVDAAGNAVAVWTQDDGPRFNIWSNRFDVAVLSWGTAERIEDDNTASTFDPHIAVGSAGHAIAVWAQGNDSPRPIWSTRFDPDVGEWDAAVYLGRSDSAPWSEPRVTADGQGNAVAVWSNQPGGECSTVLSSHFAAAAGRWSTPVAIDTDE